jgi:hypothetical protein
MTRPGYAVGRQSQVVFDLDRPPAPLGRELSRLAILLGAWVGIYIVVIIFVIAIFQASGNGAILLVLPLPSIAGWGLRVLVRQTGVGDIPAAAPYRTVDGAQIGYGGEHPRRPDREERVAWRSLKRHRITRIQYERVRARRHLVHGEIDRIEYQMIVEQLNELDPTVSKRA